VVWEKGKKKKRGKVYRGWRRGKLAPRRLGGGKAGEESLEELAMETEKWGPL